MSRENLETVRAVWERFNRDGAMPEDLFDPEVVFYNVRESPMPGPYHGYEGLRSWRDAIFEVLEDWRYAVEETSDVAQPDLVVHKLRLLGRARHSGIAVDVVFTLLVWFREGRIRRMESFSDHAEALAAAGPRA